MGQPMPRDTVRARSERSSRIRWGGASRLAPPNLTRAHLGA
jgi:hypothetical protein